MKFKLLFLLFYLYLCNVIYAQNSTNFGVFPTIDHSGILSKKLSYSLYYFGALNILNQKINNVKQEPNLLLLYSEQALHYAVNSNLTTSASYVREILNPLHPNFRTENRFYVQTTLKHSNTKTEFKHRLRYDGRFIKDRITPKASFTHRLRYLFGIKKTINSQTYFTAYNEFFFNTYKSSKFVYAENWAAFAIGKSISKNNKIEVGPLYIFWVNNARYHLTNLIYLQATWVSQINFIKQK